MRTLGLLLLGYTLLSGGCTLALSFDQCIKDADCPRLGGKRQFCTAERMCVTATPQAQMCKDTFPASAPAGAVPVGAILRLSAEGGSDDLLLKGIQLAVKEVNSYTGAGQRPIVLHICDSARTPEDALSAMRYLVRERKVVAVVGPTSSREVIAVAKEAGNARVPLVSPSATAAAISTLPQQGYIFRVAPSDNLQGKKLVALLSAQSPHVALLYVDDDYGTGLQGAFAAELFRVHMKTPAFAVKFAEENAGQVTAASEMVRMASGLTDVVIVANLDAPTLVRQLAMLPLSARVLMTDGAKSNAVLEAAKSLDPMHIARISGTAPTVSSGAVYVKFTTEFFAEFRSDPSADAFSAYAYDAMYAVAVALGASDADMPTGDTVSTGLKRISGNNNLTPVGRTDYLTAVRNMAAGRFVPLDGATGEIRFDSRGDRTSALFEKWTIEKGQFKSSPL